MKKIDEQMEDAGIEVNHYFSTGLYTREHIMPANTRVVQHKHNFNHTSILASGTVMVTNDNKQFEITGPAVMVIEAEQLHSILAITDAVWMCIHATDKTCVADIEHEIVSS